MQYRFCARNPSNLKDSPYMLPKHLWEISSTSASEHPIAVDRTAGQITVAGDIWWNRARRTRGHPFPANQATRYDLYPHRNRKPEIPGAARKSNLSRICLYRRPWIRTWLIRRLVLNSSSRYHWETHRQSNNRKFRLRSSTNFTSMLSSLIDFGGVESGECRERIC